MVVESVALFSAVEQRLDSMDGFYAKESKCSPVPVHLKDCGAVAVHGFYAKG